MYNIAEELLGAMDGGWPGHGAAHAAAGAVPGHRTNVNDEGKLNRVKCLPIENEQVEETDWCYVMAPLGGKECGQFFFPSVNDLVVLAYLGATPTVPWCWAPSGTPR